jgi:NADP-dependent 3-hydroxy acid dehydrogenase YdfG
MGRELAGRRALITGAASGVGLAVTERLLEEGLRVVGVDKRAAPIDHDGLVAIEADITDAADVDRCYAELADEVGGLDVLVSNAGVGIHERLDQGDPDKWQAVVETNLVGAMRVVRAFVPLLEESAGVADVVIVSSVADRKPYAFGAAYAASKAGLSAMAETLRLEVQPDVRVTLMRLGLVATSFFEHSMGASTPTPEQVGCGVLAPEQVAEALCFALARPASVAVNELTLRPADQPF